jgi:methyl-accepting chemotaxis protein
MNIKQKLILAFAAIASLPVILVAVLSSSTCAMRPGQFIDSSGREIRQVDNAMQLFFEGISQNVAYLAAHPQLQAIDADETLPERRCRAKSPRATSSCSLFEGLAKSHSAYLPVPGHRRRRLRVLARRPQAGQLRSAHAALVQDGHGATGQDPAHRSLLLGRDNVVLVSTVRASPTARARRAGW